VTKTVPVGRAGTDANGCGEWLPGLARTGGETVIGTERRHHAAHPGPWHLRSACAEDREPGRGDPAWRSCSTSTRCHQAA